MPRPAVYAVTDRGCRPYHHAAPAARKGHEMTTRTVRILNAKHRRLRRAETRGKATARTRAMRREIERVRRAWEGVVS